MRPTRYETRVVKVMIAKESDPVFSEHAVFAEIEDGGGGEYIKLSQLETEEGGIEIGVDNWDEVKAAVDFLIEDIKVREERKRAARGGVDTY
jgi:hypothetical protein